MSETVRGMIASLRWGANLDDKSPAHIMKGRSNGDEFERTECGVYVLAWGRQSLIDVRVCKRCLKATEKYA